MSETATKMTWPEPVDDRLYLEHYQHLPQFSQPPFEISQKARRILGLGVDGLHVNIPAVRLTTATPENWSHSHAEVRGNERVEIHLAEQSNKPTFVGSAGEDVDRKRVGSNKSKKVEDKKQVQYEFPTRHYNAGEGFDVKPSKRYCAQPDVVKGKGQGRASLDSCSPPMHSVRLQQGRASLDLPRQKPSQNTRASLDLPVKKGLSRMELMLPRPMSVAVHGRQGRASLDSSRQRPSLKIEPRSTRPVSFATDKPGVRMTGAGGPPSPLPSATRRRKPNSFPNFSRPLSQLESKSVPADIVERARRSMERSGVRQGEVLRPKIVGVDDLHQGITVTREIVIVGDEKVEQQTSLPRKTEAIKGPNTQPDPPFSPKTDIRYVSQAPSIPNAPSPFNNTSMAVFPDDEDDKKPKSKPMLSKIFTSLPLRLLRTGHRRIVSESGTHSSRVGRGGAYSKFLLTEENLRHLEVDVGSVPKIYALDLSLLATSPGTPERRIYGLSSPPLLSNNGPETPPISQHPAKAQLSADAVPAMKSLPSLPNKIPPQTLLKDDAPAKPELPERMRIPRIRQTCAICKETRHIAHFSTWAPTTRCKHPSQTCVPCMQKWIATCIETKGWDSCICPECSEPLAYDDVKLFATQEVFDRYDHLSTRAALSLLQNFHWCQSPTCSSGNIYDESLQNNSIFTCVSCGHSHCINHPSIPYHTGETCAEYDARTAPPSPSVYSQQPWDERANVQCIRETSKRCPNALCGWYIEKNAGCDKMTCSKCRFEFCWECCAPFGPIYRKGNKFHKEGCKYWG